MHRYLKKLVDERNALTGLMQSLSDTAVREDRELSEAEAERMRGWQERAAQLDRDCAEQNEYLTSQRAWATLQDQLAANAADDSPAGGGVALATRSETPPSWGEAFTSSEQFRRYDGTGSSGRVEVPGLFERAAITTTWQPGLPPYQFSPALPSFTTPLLDAIGRERVSTNAIEWTMFRYAPEAAVVAEGALKPEADFAPTRGAAALETLAHYKGITRQALEDIPRIQSIVENALRQGVLRKLEGNVAAALEDSTDIPEASGDGLLAAIRAGMAAVQLAGYATANAVLIHPNDLAALDTAALQYQWGGPPNGSGTSFWGLRAIPVASLAPGTAYVGDFKTGVTLFERGNAAVYMTDSHADFFLRNTLVILAETRALAVVTEPQAVVRVEAAAAGTNGGAPAGGQ